MQWSLKVSSCNHSFIANFCHLEVLAPTEQCFLWPGHCLALEACLSLPSSRALQADGIQSASQQIGRKYQRNQTKHAKATHTLTALPTHHTFHHSTISLTHSTHSASSSTPSVASKSFLMLSNNAFATQGGTAFPICFLT
jgi:hypothetical protein